MADGPDPGSLALVLPNDLAPRVLAWWEVVRPGPGEVDLAALERLFGKPREEIQVSIELCELAGLVGPEGISDVAKRWLTKRAMDAMGL